MATRYGLQPARQVLFDQGLQIPQVAEKVNVPPDHLRSALYGNSTPSPALRDRLPVVLAVPLSRLFTEESLAARYHPGLGPGGRVRPGQSWLTNWDER